MRDQTDRLYELLPVVYRLRDADQGSPLRALLRVIAEQANLVESDIAQLYENWFIETCQDWVVPYIGDLIGYTMVHEAGEPSTAQTSRAVARDRILIARREVANTIRYRRRKGTLRLLEELAAAVAGWPARAVEFYRLLGVTQNIDYLRLDRGRIVDLRDGDALNLLSGPFDQLAHMVDVRCGSSPCSSSIGNIPCVGLFVWRLKAYSVTQTPAYRYEEESPNCYLFSPLGIDTQLYTHANFASPSLGYNSTELNFPTPIRRRSFERLKTSATGGKTSPGVPAYYGDGKSIEIWVGSPPKPVSPDQIVAADLTDWTYRPMPNQVAVDPELGRIVFPPGQAHRQNVLVSYYYAFSTEFGGGEYDRPIKEPANSRLYFVGGRETFTRVNDALKQWGRDQPTNAVIEITDSGVYDEQINVSLSAGQSLQLRAANRKRPVIRLLGWENSLPDNLSVSGEQGTWFTLDGLLITGRGVQIEGNISGVTIRHSTLVPGWGLHHDCEPKRPAEPSLMLVNSPDCVTIEHSIIGSIRVDRDEVKTDPVRIRVQDSILDATSQGRVAVGAPESLCAHAALIAVRTTVFGQTQVHSIELAENSIFMGLIRACRRQRGCVRFSYVPPGSRTPRRFECQPDLVDKSVAALIKQSDLTAEQRDAIQASERLRVEPEFNSTRYGTPTYCQLADTCASEITRGADDESEMGVFHDLYQPQRAANLRARLDDYTPAGTEAGIIYAS
jgi:hypothetical protein